MSTLNFTFLKNFFAVRKYSGEQRKGRLSAAPLKNTERLFFVSLPGVMICVEQVVGLFSQGSSQILLI